ncbi:hypothetical protein GCM10009415_00900 [Chitinophaga japonensis]
MPINYSFLIIPKGEGVRAGKSRKTSSRVLSLQDKFTGTCFALAAEGALVELTVDGLVEIIKAQGLQYRHFFVKVKFYTNFF